MKNSLRKLVIEIIIALLFCSCVCALSYSDKESIKVDFIKPEQGKTVKTSVTLKIRVFMNGKLANDSYSDWKVAYYLDGVKAAQVNSIDRAIDVSADRLKSGKHLITCNVLTENNTLGVANRYIVVEK